MKIKEKFLKTILMMLVLFCVSITPSILAEEVNAASSYEYQVLDLVNQERAKVGVAPLKMDKELYDAAQIRSKEINTVFSHTRPDGSSWSTVSPKARGENIAKGSSTAQGVMSLWMNSEGHRNNILNPNYKSIGIGYYKGSSSCWVQLFGTVEANERLESTTPTPNNPTPNNPTPNNPTPNNPTPNNPNLNNNQNPTINNNQPITPYTVKKPACPTFSLVSADKKIVIKWKKVAKASGYQVYSATKKTGKYILRKTINKGSILQYTDKNLIKNKKYFYKVRSFKLNNGKKVFSKFSSIKSKTTK